MKDEKFIELLNLYVDREITPADAALLEEAILREPRRRETYRQYCQMHRACSLVSDRFAANAPAVTLPSAEANADKFVEFPAQKRRPHWSVYAAGFAAAACVAFVALHTTNPSAVATHPAAQPAALTAAASPATVNAVSTEAKPMLARIEVPLNDNLQAVPVGTYLVEPVQTSAAPKPDAMAMAQADDFLPPLPVFDANSGPNAFANQVGFTTGNRQTFDSRAPAGGATVQMTAFQFQK